MRPSQSELKDLVQNGGRLHEIRMDSCQYFLGTGDYALSDLCIVYTSGDNVPVEYCGGSELCRTAKREHEIKVPL